MSVIICHSWFAFFFLFGIQGMRNIVNMCAYNHVHACWVLWIDELWSNRSILSFMVAEDLYLVIYVSNFLSMHVCKIGTWCICFVLWICYDVGVRNVDITMLPHVVTSLTWYYEKLMIPLELNITRIQPAIWWCDHSMHLLLWNCNRNNNTRYQTNIAWYHQD